MNRRTFIDRISFGGTGVLISPFLINGCNTNDKPDKPEWDGTWMEKLVIENDGQVAMSLSQQVIDPNRENFGGIPDAYQIFHAGSAAGFIQRLTGSFVSPGSVYHHDWMLVERMQWASDFLEHIQHDDGTIDLLTTNFHSTPDTGFVVEPLAISYKLLRQDDQDGTLALRASLRTFLISAAGALKVGGIHTPNHRWVVAMALARIHELFPDKTYVERIDRWLGEGIDIDEDGQFTERSTAVYSPLTDRCLITLARLLDRPTLMEPVRRNLEMTMYYLHPNGEIVTEASRRQDQYLARTPDAYYYPYRFMSLYDRNSSFGAMVIAMEQNLGAKTLSNNLVYLLEDPTINKAITGGSLPHDFSRHFKASSLSRIRRSDRDATILGKNSALLTFHHGDSVLQAVRLATAFFGKGQFISDDLTVSNDKYRLTQHLEGPYYQPFPEELIPEGGDWEKMPKDQRTKSEIQKMDYTLDIQEIDEGFQLDFSAEGTDHVPLAIELSFRKGGQLTGGQSTNGGEDIYFMLDDHIQYRKDDYAIQVQGALHQHNWTQLRGAEPRIDGVSIYLTGYTPLKHRLLVRALKV